MQVSDIKVETGDGRRLRRPSFAKRNVIPGFGLTFGFTLAWISLIVLLPLSALFLKAAGMSFHDFIEVGFSTRALRAYQLSFGASLVAGLVNSVFGLLIAWVLVRYQFPGRRLVGALVDLPFALPTAVAGIALATLYAENGWIGGLLAPMGIKVAFTRIGVVVALIFVGLPFVVRSVEPVLADFGSDLEEAAATLGATPFQTFRRIILPAIAPALLTGFALAFARGVGEYGSVIFVAGNMPYRSEIAPLLIVTQLEQFDYAGATAIASIMLVAAFAVLLLINLLQHYSRRGGASQ